MTSGHANHYTTVPIMSDTSLEHTGKCKTVLENKKMSFKKGVIMWVFDNSRGQTTVDEAKKDQDKNGSPT